jgi:sugar phosphate isomerase/epimerase
VYKSLSSALLGFQNRALKDDIPLAVKYGYEGIYFDIKKEAAIYSASQFTDLLVNNKLKPGGFNLPVDFRSSDENYEADLKALPGYCAFAKETRSFRCITWITPWSNLRNYKENFEFHKDKLTPVAKILEDHDIRFGFEFVGPLKSRQGKTYEFIHTLDGLKELLDAIGTSNLGYLLDVWHWDTAGQVFEDFKKIPDNESIVMVHVNDAPKGLRMEEQDDHNRELPGATGILRIDEFMKALVDLKYDGPVLVEPFNEPLKAMPFEEAVKAAKLGMDKIWPKQALAVL